jgi:hypothetical protein
MRTKHLLHPPGGYLLSVPYASSESPNTSILQVEYNYKARKVKKNPGYWGEEFAVTYSTMSP